MSTRVEPLQPSSTPWLMAGTLGLVALLLLTWRLGQLAGPAGALASKASRVDLVQRVKAGLASAAVAELRAVLARTDEDAAREAGEARALTAEAERDRQALEQLIAAGGVARERELLAGFTRAFAALQQVDEEVLSLAARNTNLEAFTLAFGRAADELGAAGQALSRLAEGRAGAPDEARVLQAALGTRVALLEIQAVLAPHIAEASDEAMDRLEWRIAAAEAAVAHGLQALAAIPGLAAGKDLARARSAAEGYHQLLVRILALSRENTNVRSVAISLDQRRVALGDCLAALEALGQAVAEEHIPGVAYGRPVRAR